MNGNANGSSPNNGSPAQRSTLNVNVTGNTQQVQNGPNSAPNNAPGGVELSPEASRRASPAGVVVGSGIPSGMADSIASLPAMPSRSTPGTPGSAGPGGPNTGGNNSGSKMGFSSLRGPGAAGGVAGGSALEGLTAAQRGYSNPDLVKAFSKAGPQGYAGGPMGGPRVSGMLCSIISGLGTEREICSLSRVCVFCISALWQCRPALQ